MGKRGFTLVELSIVIVVIGLLIGGILGAQSMVQTAKLNGAMRVLSQYEIAVSNFKTKFSQLPGDDTLFPDALGNVGNNDGLIGEHPADWDYIAVEIGREWSSLSLGVDLRDSSGEAFSSWNDGTWFHYLLPENCPRFKLNEFPSASFADITCLMLLSNSAANGINITPANSNRFWYGVYRDRRLGNIIERDPLTSIDTLSIDKKIDDGKPSAGIFRGVTYGVSAPAQCAVSGDYNLSSKDFICSFTLELPNI